LITLSICTAFLAMGCLDGDDFTIPSTNGKGSLQVVSSLEENVAEVETRTSSGYALPSEVIPAAETMKLRITGKYQDSSSTTQDFDQTWTSVKSFNTEDPKFNFGTYKAYISSGDIEIEGAKKPYFYGESDEIVVATTRPTQASVKASLKNSCFTVVLGEWLKNYYKDIVIKISTTNNIYSFDQYSASEDVDHLIFIKPGQTLKVSGTAKKKQTDVEVEFPATVIAGGKLVEAETKYTITVDHSSAGGETISIGFDGTFTDIEPQVVELNPEV
ncbi:MAG: DUF4493 domain-containing protein, partial [Alistipes sp.]|nr:DUF4493 domain-containing protein [Candidatus Alistipes equi]